MTKHEHLGHTNGHHDHDHGHDHDHHHGKGMVYGYFAALGLTGVALFLPPSMHVLAACLYVVAMILAGYHVLIEEGFLGTWRTYQTTGQFKPDSHVLMGLAAIGSCILGDFWEGALLVLIFAGAHFLEEYAEGHSQREIQKLLSMTPSTARRIVGEHETEIVNVSDLVIGDRLHVLNGDQIPIDGVVISGEPVINESAINGESVPRDKTAGDPVYGGTLNGDTSFVMEVTVASEDTLFAKIVELVSQNQVNQTPTATFIERFEPRYVRFVLAMVPLVILGGHYLAQWDWAWSFNRGLVILVAASPCALAAATVSATLSATSNLARQGILSKGSVYLSNLAHINRIVFDKTGTLTQGTLQVSESYFEPHASAHRTEDLLVALERESNHPIATAILAHFTPEETVTLTVENEIGRGLVGRDGTHTYRLGKPQTFDAVPDAIREREQSWSQQGNTVVYFAIDEAVVGALALMDLAKPEAPEVIRYFKGAGIEPIMLTGDSAVTGQAIGRSLGIETVLGDVSPVDKASEVERLQGQGQLVAMVGDGVNDAPALVAADVGIAMGDGTDIALEVSDLALMQNDLTKLVSAHRVSRKMERLIKQNIVFAISVAILLVISALFGLTGISVSVFLHEGSTLIVILNGLRALRGK